MNNDILSEHLKKLSEHLKSSHIKNASCGYYNVKTTLSAILYFSNDMVCLDTLLRQLN